MSEKTVAYHALILTAMLAGLACADSVSAKTLYVEKWGSNANDCAKSSPCLTVQNAINRAQKNDRIVVGPGIYAENLTIDSNANGSLEGLRLESTSGRYGTTIVAVQHDAPVINILRPGVKVGKKGKGFSVEGATTSVGIQVSGPGVSGSKIEWNRARHNAIGFYFEGEKSQIRYNIANHNTGHGIVCWFCGESLIQNNRVYDNDGQGLRLVHAQNSTVKRNLVSGNATAAIAVIGNSAFPTIRDNVAELTASGSGIHIGNATGANVAGNIAARNGTDGFGRGMYLSQTVQSDAPSVKHNLISGNHSAGLDLYGVFQATLERNTLQQNGQSGIHVVLGSTFKAFNANNTIANDDGASHCGIDNVSNGPVTYQLHYFGHGDTECGFSPLDGSFTAKPSSTKVNAARSL